jgi:hypothetical protein
VSKAPTLAGPVSETPLPIVAPAPIRAIQAVRQASEAAHKASSVKPKCARNALVTLESALDSSIRSANSSGRLAPWPPCSGARRRVVKVASRNQPISAWGRMRVRSRSAALARISAKTGRNRSASVS